VRLVHQLALFVLVLAVIEGALMGSLLYVEGVHRPSYVLVVAGVGALLTALVGLLVIRQVTRPLAELASAARQVGRGNLDVPIGVRSRDEFGQLADAFREMQARLAETRRDLERRVEERTAELRETSDSLRAVLDSSTEYAIIATDTDWTIRTFNEGARRTFGYAPEEVLGRSLGLLVPPEEAEAAMGAEMTRALESRGRHEGECDRLHKDGRRFPVRCATTVRRAPDGRPAGYTVVCRDITQHKALEHRLRQYTDNLEQMVAEKTAELQEVNAELRRAGTLKGQFLATMSHELRTPLSAIIGFAEAIRDGVAGPVAPEQREFAEDIRQAGRQLLALINNILDLAKLEAGAMNLDLQSCELGAIVEEVFRVVRGLARPKDIRLVSDLSPRKIELAADPVKLKQILYNLLSNAVKFSHAGSVVTVTGRLEPETVLVRVADTGIGIAPEDLIWIFEEFRQGDSTLARESGGTGLGLSLVKRLVELHGGDVVVESELGKGTTFTVALPRDLAPRADA